MPSDWAGSAAVQVSGGTGNVTVVSELNFNAANTQVAPPAGFYSLNPVVDFSILGDWFGSCTLTAPGTGITFVQMRYVGRGNPANAAAYEAMPANAVARQVVLPLVQKRLADGSATTISVQNLSQTGDATDLTFYYMAGMCRLR